MHLRLACWRPSSRLPHRRPSSWLWCRRATWLCAPRRRAAAYRLYASASTDASCVPSRSSSDLINDACRVAPGCIAHKDAARSGENRRAKIAASGCKTLANSKKRLGLYGNRSCLAWELYWGSFFTTMPCLRHLTGQPRRADAGVNASPALHRAYIAYIAYIAFIRLVQRSHMRGCPAMAMMLLLLLAAIAAAQDCVRSSYEYLDVQIDVNTELAPQIEANATRRAAASDKF